jgi:antitoxin MazE
MMKTKVIKIGNSRGIRIPRHILEQSGLKNEVEIEVRDNNIILKSTTRAREDWERAFQKMANNNDDILLDKESVGSLTSWDKEEWEW